MKKLVLTAVAALMTTTAFAMPKHMVRFQNMDQANNQRSFDFSLSSDDADKKDSKQNIALNYAYAINKMWQVGLSYRTETNTVDGDVTAVGQKWNETGLAGYYNFDGDLANTCYAGLHLKNKTVAETDTTGDDGFKVQTIALEYGHRWHLGEAWGMHLTFSPSVVYNMSTTSYDADKDDLKATSIAWNWVNFDVLF